MKIALKWFPLIVLFLLLSFEKSVFSIENEPDGFRGIPWGVELATLENEMVFSFTDGESGGVDYYVRKEDSLQIGDVELENIYYGFWEGQFCSVQIKTRGLKSYTALKNEYIRRFGSGMTIKGSICVEKYYWFDGRITSMLFEHNNCEAKGILYINSKEIQKRQKKQTKPRKRSWEK